MSFLSRSLIEVKTVLRQERLHERCLVATDVVADDVYFASAGLTGEDVFEEGDELLAGVAGGGLAQHFAGSGVERCEQAQRAVALVFEAMTLSAPWRQRQHLVLAVQGLDRRRLVYAEHRGVRRRVQVQTDHIGRLGLEVRVVRDHVSIESVWSHAVFAPDAQNGRERHVAELDGQLATAPVRRAILGRMLQRPVEHPGLELGHRHLRRATRMQRYQSGKPPGLERRRPLGDELVIAGELASDVDSPLCLTPKQHAPRPARKSGVTAPLAHHGVQFPALFTRQHRSLHTSPSEDNASDFNDSVD